MKPKILRTYNSVWKVEKVLYGIQDIPLPIPLTYRQIGFFAGGFILVWCLNRIPPLSLIDLGLIEYIFLPGLFSWFFTKQLLDGKAPHRFFLRVAQYHLDPHYRNRYKEITSSKKPYKYASPISYRELSYHEKEGEADEHRISG
ncbi:conjugal transfer protein [Bacillus infantis]|jgi:TcpE family|uniref:conjugal transfer protein n=1 Tax=Bacillaceae TaxID=186817 RepID=UPI000B9B0B04|nr:conjugal transfer protein [Bacillus infantis]OXT15221.1 conjugal transfer protein [Bacillus sp. OG2]HER2025534.1 conjugal transfer protein [Streptococcus pyogenes]MCA1037484.1 conjugal transfer protein [Bacillus infantis]MCA1041998.1 conjugal transfer protein [Bacillus infantis]MCK6208473.1 conjugal transfer protein [Bacillus infantis]